MRTKPTVTLVIPAYNEESYLKSCLDAALNQTIPFSQIIVVDNNSVDQTAKIASSYPQVKLVQEPKQGLRAARNNGFDAVKSDIIGRIDADSIISPDWCQQVTDFFANHQAVCLTGACYYYDMPARSIGLKLDKLARKLTFSFDKPFLYGSNMAFPRQAWQKIRDKVCSEGEFFEDCDLSIHLDNQGFSTIYSSSLVVGVSARRLAEGPISFYRYISQFNHTFGRHGRHNSSAKIAMIIYLIAYCLMKPVYLFYNHNYLNLSPKKVRPTVRPNANT